MVKILNCYFYAKKSYGTLSKGAIFFGQPSTIYFRVLIKCQQHRVSNPEPFDSVCIVLPLNYIASRQFFF